MSNNQMINGNHHPAPLTNDTREKPVCLKILIAGAGIGGFAAAVALRQQGHDVEVFEQSKFADEIGAAIHLTPNSNGALQSLGIFLKDHGANLLRETRLVSSEGQLLHSEDHTKTGVRWQHDWRLAHRAQLHSVLKAVALSDSGKGKPVDLRTSSAVASVDPAAGMITLADGTQVHGDVIVGADGVHSKTRKAISKDIEPFRTGQSAFRFLIARKSVIDHPLTHELASKPGIMTIWYKEDEGKKAVLYPCSKDELLNFVMIHPSELSSASGDYNQIGSKEKMLEIYQDFDPVLRQFLGMANPKAVKLWPLFDMKPLPTFNNKKLVLIGDAAHPFKPHLAQGGAQAIEDAISLGVMLSQVTSLEEVPERLALYEKARYNRSTTIQQYAREVGEEKSKLKGYMDVALSHDELHASKQLFRHHQWSKKPQRYWRQPISFGPMPGPLQDVEGRSRIATLLSSTCMTASIMFKTSATLLRGLFLSNSYRFASLDTIAYASFRLQVLDRIDWLAGGAYNQFGLYIHGVEYAKKNGDVISADFLPILFENAVDPIVSGGEELGCPKVYSDINIYREATSLQANFSWRGTTWGALQMHDLERAQSNGDAFHISSTRPTGLLVHKYVPATGIRGREHADADYPVYVPFEKEDEVVPTKVNATWNLAKPAQHAVVNFTNAVPRQLPTLHHIIERLAEIPIYEVVEAKVVESQGVPDFSQATRVE